MLNWRLQWRYWETFSKPYKFNSHIWDNHFMEFNKIWCLENNSSARPDRHPLSEWIDKNYHKKEKEISLRVCMETQECFDVMSCAMINTKLNKLVQSDINCTIFWAKLCSLWFLLSSNNYSTPLEHFVAAHRLEYIQSAIAAGCCQDRCTDHHVLGRYNLSAHRLDVLLMAIGYSSKISTFILCCPAEFKTRSE